MGSIISRGAAGSLEGVQSPQIVTSRVRRILGEVLRFLAVGGLATVVSFVGFNVLVHGLLIDSAPLHDRPIPAFVVVNLAAGVVAYVGMKAYAFRDREAEDTAGGIVRFFTLGALTMLIPGLCLWISRYVLHLSGPVSDNVAANVVGLGLSAGTRFWVFRRFVFSEVPAT
jgi:putative flippase GtrA